MSAQDVVYFPLKRLVMSEYIYNITFQRLYTFLLTIFFIIQRYFTFLTQCKNPKACTILLRGPSKDILNEIDRNLQDAMCVARNVFFSPLLAPGGGATEMAISMKLAENSKTIVGVEQWPYKAVAEAMEVIPRTLIQNCGGNPIKVLTQLRVTSKFVYLLLLLLLFNL
jgi:T-complex protein 1 subunit gamma